MAGNRVLDVDDRILLRSGGALVEIDPRGKARPNALAVAADTARYLPGSRDVVYQDGDPARLTVLRGGRKAVPLVEADHAVELLGVLPGRVVYRANRKHRLLFNVVIRNVLVGEEQAVYDRGGDVLSAAVSPNSRYVAIRLPRKLILVDTMPVTEDDHVRLIGPEPAGGGHRAVAWLPDSLRLLATGDGAVSRYDVETGEWTDLITDLPPGAVAVPAPDGRRLCIVDGERIAFHHAGTGDFLRAADLPTQGEPVWTPDSSTVAVATESGAATVVAQSAFVNTYSL